MRHRLRVRAAADANWAVAEGKTTKDIATLLAISVKTAEWHRSKMMERLDIHDTAGLVRYAIRQGLIQPQRVHWH